MAKAPFASSSEVTSRIHTYIYRACQSIGHAFTGSARRNIEINTRISLGEFLSPACIIGYKAKAPEMVIVPSN